MLRRRYVKALLLTCVLPLHISTHAAEALVVTLREQESARDQRGNYFNAAIQLALEKTAESHGPYRLQRAPPMNKERSLLSARQRAYQNMVVAAAPGEARGLGLVPVPVPPDLGVTGYRVCFIPVDKRRDLERTRTLDELRRFRFLQGKGSADAAILRANGFTVDEVAGHESLFAMVARGRADLLCRSLLEVHDELLAQAGKPGITLDASIVLVYDLPLLLYLHPEDKELLQRLSNGLRRAWRDGSLQALLMKYLQPALAAVALDQRRAFQLSSEQSTGLGFEYQLYHLDLLKMSREHRHRR
jgi:ABC-type amino acid transport substrate-binding protein